MPRWLLAQRRAGRNKGVGGRHWGGAAAREARRRGTGLGSREERRGRGAGGQDAEGEGSGEGGGLALPRFFAHICLQCKINVLKVRPKKRGSSVHKNISDCVRSRGESTGTPLYPAIFWLNNIFIFANFRQHKSVQIEPVVISNE